MIGFLLSSSLSVQACIEDVPIKDRGPIRIICDMTLDDTSCLHNDIEGEYSTDISSITFIDKDAYLLISGLDKYSNLLDEATVNWNQTELVHVIESEFIFNIKITEEDLGDTGFLARYIYTGDINYIVINTYYFGDLSVENQISVLTHELGHALGLDDSLNEESIMWQGLAEGKEISDVDLRNLQAVIEEMGND
jgi:hypothetical protein